jgi:hypothetical protein
MLRGSLSLVNAPATTAGLLKLSKGCLGYELGLVATLVIPESYWALWFEYAGEGTEESGESLLDEEAGVGTGTKSKSSTRKAEMSNSAGSWW